MDSGSQHAYRPFLRQTLVVFLFSFGTLVAGASTLSDEEFEEIQRLVKPSAKLTQTLTRLKKKVSEEPKNLESRLLLAKAHLSNQEPEAALDVLRPINTDIEPRALVLMQAANNQKKDYLEQVRNLELLKKMHPESEWVMLHLAEAYELSKNINKSVETLKEVIKKYPKRKQAHFHLLDLYERTKNSYENRILLSDMSSKFKGDSQVFNRLCRAYSQASFLKEADETCSKAIGLDPNIPENHVYYGLTRKYLKDTVQGERIIKKAAKEFPNSELAQVTSGELNEEQKNHEAARRNYILCTKNHGTSGKCWAGLARTSFAIGSYEEALTAYQKACKLEPKSRAAFRASVTSLRIKEKLELADRYNRAFDQCTIGSEE